MQFYNSCILVNVFRSKKSWQYTWAWGSEVSLRNDLLTVGALLKEFKEK